MNPGHWHSITPKIAAEIRKARCEKGWTIFDLRRELNRWLGKEFTVASVANTVPINPSEWRGHSFSDQALYKIEAGVPHKINSVRAAAFVAVLGKDFWAIEKRRHFWRFTNVLHPSED